MTVAESRVRAQHAGVRVLLVEDEPISREFASELLQDAGLVVDLATDGEQALALARRGDHALILMDLQMPRLDGLAAARAIRAQPGGARVPILALTANADDEDRRRCLAAGMNEHLAKPIEPAVLFEALLRWLPAGPLRPGVSGPNGENA